MATPNHADGRRPRKIPLAELLVDLEHLEISLQSEIDRADSLLYNPDQEQQPNADPASIARSLRHAKNIFSTKFDDVSRSLEQAGSMDELQTRRTERNYIIDAYDSKLSRLREVFDVAMSSSASVSSHISDNAPSTVPAARHSHADHHNLASARTYTVGLPGRRRILPSIPLAPAFSKDSLDPEKYDARSGPNIGHDLFPGYTYQQQQRSNRPSDHPVRHDQHPFSSPTSAPIAPNASHAYLRRELMKKSDNPFDGSDPSEYWAWQASISSEMDAVPLSDAEKIKILLANTSGDVRVLVSNFRTAGGCDSAAALKSIWVELGERYGQEVKVARSLKKRLKDFPPVKGPNRSQVGLNLRRLADLCKLVEIHVDHVAELSSLNTSEGTEFLREKLPDWVEHEWFMHGSKYAEEHGGAYPPFAVFTGFIKLMADRSCNGIFDSFSSNASPVPTRPKSTPKTAHALRTNAVQQPNQQVPAPRATLPNQHPIPQSPFCLYHFKYGHLIFNCRDFREAPVDGRLTFVRKSGLCPRCLDNHQLESCVSHIRCETCHSGDHHGLLHRPDVVILNSGLQQPPTSLNQQQPHASGTPPSSSVRSGCLHVCGRLGSDKSCGKTLLVDIEAPNHSNRTLRAYVIIDNGSNYSFADQRVLDFFGIEGPRESYKLDTVDRLSTNKWCTIARGLTVRGVNENRTFALPQLLGCDELPCTKDEIATPEIVAAHSHVAKFAKHFQPLDPNAEVLLLIGLDGGDLLWSKQHGNTFPFVHHTALGWAMLGGICPDSINTDTPKHAKALRCKVHLTAKLTGGPPRFNPLPVIDSAECLLKTDPFTEAADDDLPGTSADDRKFLQIVSANTLISESQQLIIPLPFRDDKVTLPDNRNAVYRRTRNTLNRMKRDPDTLAQSLAGMATSIRHGHVEEIPLDWPPPTVGRVWCLPVFPVRHKQKGTVRNVFDASASFMGESLNDALLQGPDEMNQLKGVLTRFREGLVPFVADVQFMFYNFLVPIDQRDFQRFWWYSENDPEKAIVEYRACVHLFGSRSSPAVATYGLRFAARDLDGSHDEAQRTITQDMYVDDLCSSAESPEAAIAVLRDAISVLATKGIRLHKIVSCCAELMDAFPTSECVTDTPIDLCSGEPSHRTLGISWHFDSDSFTIKTNLSERPFTKRGILSTMNAVFDPLGLISPIILQARLIQREVNDAKHVIDDKALDWDDELPDSFRSAWNGWTSRLKGVEALKFPRCFRPPSFGTADIMTLHVFCDASENAIGHVSYMRCTNTHGLISVVFIGSDSKVAPRTAVTIPRLELCAALEAVTSTTALIGELRRQPDEIFFYSDSKITLGYIRNDEKRFSRYVSNRSNAIRKGSSPSQWAYIDTTTNPADLTTRITTPEKLLQSAWIRGPEFLRLPNFRSTDVDDEIDADQLPEVDHRARVLRTVVSTASRDPDSLWNPLFNPLRVSRWSRLLNIVCYVRSRCKILAHRVRQKLAPPANAPSQPLPASDLLAERNQAATALIRCAQLSSSGDLIASLDSEGGIHKSHRLARLSPFSDNGLIRIGGRVSRADISADVANPVFVPCAHPISSVIIQHFHLRNHHQGRHVTHGSIRDAGFYIQSGHKTIGRFLRDCVPCQRQRGRLSTQVMAELPADRLSMSPPFTNTGLDLCGPFLITEGKATRRHCSTTKTWVLLLTCLTTRAVHVELLRSLDTPTFLLGLRRFFAERGVCRRLRSDNGSNFLQARRLAAGVETTPDCDIDVDSISTTVLQQHDCEWELNPPHASWYGGAWERKIGCVRRVLDATMRLLGPRNLSHDELLTTVKEAASVVNNTPLAELSYDADSLRPITPAMIMTLKDDPNPPPLESFTEKDVLAYGSRRWRRTAYLNDQFWMRWRNEVFESFRPRRKWLTTQRNLTVGDLVLVRDKCAKRNIWPTARVIEVFPSDDGYVRKVKIQRADAQSAPLMRPVHELVLLLAGD